MKKNHKQSHAYVFLVTLLCAISTLRGGYEECEKFLDQVHRQTLGSWIPPYEVLKEDFFSLIDATDFSDNPRRHARFQERFLALTSRAYAQEGYIRTTVEESEYRLAQYSPEVQSIFQSTKQMLLGAQAKIKSIDRLSLGKLSLEAYFANLFKKEVMDLSLPSIPAPSKVLFENGYEEEREDLQQFLDAFHSMNLQSSVPPAALQLQTFNDNLEVVLAYFETSSDQSPEAIYTVKSDIIHAYTRFIPIMMQYYFDNSLVQQIFNDARTHCEKLDPGDTMYPELTQLLDATQKMIDIAYNIGGTGPLAQAAKKFVSSFFKKTVR